MDETADVAAKVPKSLKERLTAFAKLQMESESSIIRKALDSFSPKRTTNIVQSTRKG